MKKNELQYSLSFNFDEQDDNNVVPVTGGNYLSAVERVLQDETLCRIKLSDLYAAEWVDELLLNTLIRNGKEYLMDFLKMKEKVIQTMRGIGQRRAEPLLLWQQQILSDPQPYVDFYKQYVSCICLPDYLETGTLRHGSLLRLFVQQYMDYLKRIHLEEVAQMLALYLGLDGEPLTMKQIAGQFSLSSERIRQKLAEVSGDWMKLCQGETLANIQASEVLKETIKMLYDYLYHPVLLHQMRLFLVSEASSEADIVRRFTDLLSFFQLDLLEENYTASQMTYLIVRKNEKGIYQKTVSSLNSILRTSPFWFTWQMITDELAKRENGQELNVDLIRAVLLHNPCFERTDDDCFRLKWPLFNNMQQEIRRILLDARKPLFRKELLDVYNAYSRLYGCATIIEGQLVISSDAYFVNQKKSGLWLYSPEGKQLEDVRVFMSSYIVANGGKINMEDLISVVYEAGYRYSNETLRAYISVFCRVCLHDNNSFIHRDYVSLYPEIPLRKAFSRLKKKSSPAYYDQVMQRAVELLEPLPAASSELIVISKQCEKLIPPGINRNVIYKILRSSEQLDIYVDTASNKKWIRLLPL